MGPDLSNPSITDHDTGMEQRSLALGRDERDVFDHNAVIHDGFLVGLTGGEGNQHTPKG
jgi:hypothetical protein